eukprot:4879559-Amphidinium_carterae.1
MHAMKAEQSFESLVHKLRKNMSRSIANSRSARDTYKRVQDRSKWVALGTQYKEPNVNSYEETQSFEDCRDMGAAVLVLVQCLRVVSSLVHSQTSAVFLPQVWPESGLCVSDLTFIVATFLAVGQAYSSMGILPPPLAYFDSFLHALGYHLNDVPKCHLECRGQSRSNRHAMLS